MSAVAQGGYGDEAIQAMVDASESTSQSWAEFYRKLMILTSSAVQSLPPHQIQIQRLTTGYTIQINGPVYQVLVQGTMLWPV
jgi:hypothetical protein